MIATVALLAITPLEEVAHLGLVNALCDPQVDFSVCKHAVIVLAFALQECFAQLCLLHVRLDTKFISRMSIPAIV
jgi:hypothetical protein